MIRYRKTLTESTLDASFRSLQKENQIVVPEAAYIAKDIKNALEKAMKSFSLAPKYSDNWDIGEDKYGQIYTAWNNIFTARSLVIVKDNFSEIYKAVLQSLPYQNLIWKKDIGEDSFKAPYAHIYLESPDENNWWSIQINLSAFRENLDTEIKIEFFTKE